MINENMAKQISDELEKDFPNTNKLGLKPTSSTTTLARSTVTADIEALKAKLDALQRGINMLKDQL